MNHTSHNMPLAWLPNIAGFQFVGFLHNGQPVKCHIEKQENGLHKIAGGANYSELKAWKNI